MALDPVLLVGLVTIGAFMLVFVIWPLARVIVQGSFTMEGEPSLGFFPSDTLTLSTLLQYWQDLCLTIRWECWASQSAALSTRSSCVYHGALQYAVQTRVYACARSPLTILPPFAIALSAILLLGRSGSSPRM